MAVKVVQSPLLATMQNGAAYGAPGLPDYTLLAQQKRQNSMLAYALDPAGKRMQNPLQMLLSMQSNVPGASAFSQTLLRRNRLFNLPNAVKTPTPQGYDVPMSPSGAPQNLDLSGLSPNAPSHTLELLGRYSDEEQQLATKLKETYKNIVNFEELVQKSCIDLTLKINQTTLSISQYSAPYQVPNTLELSNNLWTIYHLNITLLNNYYDFLTAALKPSNGSTLTGKNIVDLYKIPRRMWVYGIVGFLEVLKNTMTLFNEHEIFSCFIAYCFNIVLVLTDPIYEMEGWWCEKLGDLLRMAIALYSLRWIDWKTSAEYWYSGALKTMFGHGKIYYHMCTVQQDNLDALVNIGKLVVCRDPFVPTQQYLRLVVENICTQRNILLLLELPIIDFIKIHKVLLLIHSNALQEPASLALTTIHDAQLEYGIDLVTRYGLTFGLDSHGFNFFSGTFGYAEYTEHRENALGAEHVNFWLNKGPLFAVANINHVVGFGDPKNPFAKVFGLPEALKERRDKKERKHRSKNENIDDASLHDVAALLASELLVLDWFYCLSYVNKLAFELAVRILTAYLAGPRLASTGHVIVWLYFLVALGEAMSQFPNSRNMFLWLLRRFFPWQLLLTYLNSTLALVLSNVHLRRQCCERAQDHLTYFANNEFLPEVWKCWGTLWFDFVAPKTDYSSLKEAGVSSSSLFDVPICGGTEKRTEHDEARLIRIVLLARHIADNYAFGLVRTADGFRFDARAHTEVETNLLLLASGEVAAFVYDAMFADERLVQNDFVVPVAPAHLTETAVDSAAVDAAWFTEEVELSAHHALHQQQHEQALRGTLDEYNGYVIGPDVIPCENQAIIGNLGDRMDTTLTSVTMDTNIWLKFCGRIYKCVRSRVLNVLVPLIVFQELRLLRKSAEATIADAATRLVIIIRELAAGRYVVPLRFDGLPAADINETEEFENNPNWLNNVDSTTLHVVSCSDSAGKKLLCGLNHTLSGPQPVTLDRQLALAFRYCILITDDRNLRLRAKSLGVTSCQSKWLFSQLEAVLPEKCID